MSSTKTMAALLFALAGVAFAQQPPAAAETPEQKMERLRRMPAREVAALLEKDPANATLLVRLTELGDPAVTPLLVKLYDATDDRTRKAQLAAALIRSKQPQYFEPLAAEVEKVLADDAPFPLGFDEKGILVPRKLTAEFIEWAKGRKLDPNEAALDRMYGHPLFVLTLAMARDARALPLLRRAAQSANYFLRAPAAQGLAVLGDARAVEPILAAADTAPAQFAPAIAKYLVYFDDAKAQAAADRLVPNKTILEAHRRRARTGGAASIFAQ